MEKTIDLNSSFMSTASAISAIGLESTLTEEFQELKAFQAEVAHQVDRVVDYFDRVKDIVVDELKNGSGQRLLDLETFDEERHAAVDLLRSYYEKTAVAVQFYVDERSKRRVKKIHRFVNVMKVRLSATKEMAADGEPEEEDALFLAERSTTFPATAIPEEDLEQPVASTPAKSTVTEKKSIPKGFSEIRSTYSLRGK